MDQNNNENIGFYIFYTTEGYYLTYNTLLFMLVKYKDSRELVIVMISINVLQVIINHVKVVNIYESYYGSYIAHKILYHYRKKGLRVLGRSEENIDYCLWGINKPFQFNSVKRTSSVHWKN